MTRNTPPNYLLSTRFTFIVFKYITPHAEVVYAHQASILGALEEKRNTYLPVLPARTAILFQKTSRVRMTKIGNVQNSG